MVIKNFKQWIACLLILCCTFWCVCACDGERTPDGTETIKVTIVDSFFFQADRAEGEVEYGGTFTTKLSMLSDYKVLSCDYSDYIVEDKEDGTVLLTLRNITRPARVTITAGYVANRFDLRTIDCTLTYDYNGGTDADNAFQKTERYTSSNHLRPNTFNGSGVIREGYTLLGWNTQADGGGEHIGLGSRVTVKNGSSITLYAEWAAWSDTNDFLYQKNADGTLTLIGYKGNASIDPFVIPGTIDGTSVSVVSASFTTNMPNGKLTGTTLILPESIRILKSNSFRNSSFSEIYFYDSIEEVADGAFPYNLKTYHINAVEPPCFQAVNDNTIFADSVDRLILNIDKKKMIFFSGCSFTYGLNSQTIENAFEGYTVYNMGFIGSIDAAFQMEIILNYIGNGDVFVHAPEQMSQCQLMYSHYVNGMMFVMVEGNYDLLALADFSSNNAVWKAFFDYKSLKADMEPCNYTDGRCESFNIYGDYAIERAYDEMNEAARDVTYSDNAYYPDVRLLSDAGMKRLTSYYDRIEACGGKVCVSYAPVNVSIDEETNVENASRQFAFQFEKMLSEYGYKPVSDIFDYLFVGRYFYDADYHLNDVGAILRTQRLIEDIRAVLLQSN